jgi:hypothetical protein
MSDNIIEFPFGGGEPQRFGGWIQTYTGDRIYPLDPKPEEINIEDIAHSLSLQCRYNGHCERFYSVAEHSLLLSYLVEPEYALDALMHDASEAYLADIPRPIKPYLQGYYEHEASLMAKISEVFHFSWPMPDQVKEYDTRILNDERIQNMSEGKYEWDDYGEPLGVSLLFLSPNGAEKAFLERFFELTL